jgi:glycosyltransferase involved in cell wall biosynthesis
MKILVLTRYGAQGASSRVRFLQFLPALSAAGIDTLISPLIGNDLLMRKYQRGGYASRPLIVAYARRIRCLLMRHRFDLIWIEKEALPWLPAWVEKFLLRGVPYAVDFDDAIFHDYDLHPSYLVRAVLGERIDKLMAGARLIVAGNSYLAARAKRATVVPTRIIPTVVDINRYRAKVLPAQSARPRIVWIGSPSTTRYLSMLIEPLKQIASTSMFTLRLIGGANLRMPGVDVETVAWSENTEVEAIRECDIGVMPLMDTPSEQGKCAYKLIQYMACGLPTVASAVGANCDVTVEGHTGYLARDESDWREQLGALLRDAALRQRMGSAGRVWVEQKYSLQRTAPQLISLLRQAAGASR